MVALAEFLVKNGLATVAMVHELRESRILWDTAAGEGLQIEACLRTLMRGNNMTAVKALNSFPEIDIKKEIAARPQLRGLGEWGTPTQEMVNSFSKELWEARNAAHPFEPVCIRDITEYPWRPDLASHDRAWSDERSRQNKRGATTITPNAAQHVLYRIRMLFAGELVGAWDKYGGLGTQMEALLRNLAVGVESNMETLGRLFAVEQQHYQRSARSRMDPAVITEEIRRGSGDLLRRVQEDQRRSYYERTSGPRDTRDYRPHKRSHDSHDSRARETRGCQKSRNTSNKRTSSDSKKEAPKGKGK